MQNYLNYFTEIEEHFQRRRGSLHLLSTLDWALIETWREAGVPLAAVLAGIDASFDKYDARKHRARARRVNGLAYCAQEVMSAVADMQEAALGAKPSASQTAPAGFEPDRVAAHLEQCAQQIRAAGQSSLAAVEESLRTLAGDIQGRQPNLEELEQKLTMMEEKLFATLIAGAPEDELLTLRQQAAAELAPYRSRMPAMQSRQVEQQLLQKRLLEKRKLPRLSLFYMNQS